MSFLELVQFQQARLPALSKVIGLIQLRYEQLKAEAEDKPQPQPNQQGQMPDWLQNEVIDSELLFLDTALLRTLVAGSDIEPFYYDLYEAIKTISPMMRTRPATRKQLDYLLKHDFDPELLEMLSKGNASAIIGTLIKHKKTTDKQRGLLKGCLLYTSPSPRD